MDCWSHGVVEWRDTEVSTLGLRATWTDGFLITRSLRRTLRATSGAESFMYVLPHIAAVLDERPSLRLSPMPTAFPLRRAAGGTQGNLSPLRSALRPASAAYRGPGTPTRWRAPDGCLDSPKLYHPSRPSLRSR
jgi:hypothetical protein